MDILDCDWKFRFQCPKQWEQLASGDNPDVRHCDTCQRNVYLCKSFADVGKHSSEGHCVAIGFSESESVEETWLIGDIDDDYLNPPPRLRVTLVAYLIVGSAILTAASFWLLFRH